MLFTVIGTLSHEFAHFSAAYLMGYHPSMNYGYTFCEGVVDPINSFIITLSGPLQTIGTGTLGIIILLCYRNDFYTANKLSFKQWLVVFISLFWLREVYNFLQGIVIHVLEGEFPSGSDEVRLARELGINELSITSTAAFIGSCVLAYIVFVIIPVRQRLTFIVSGLTGGLLGYYFWFHVIGPLVMP